MLSEHPEFYARRQNANFFCLYGDLILTSNYIGQGIKNPTEVRTRNRVSPNSGRLLAPDLDGSSRERVGLSFRSSLLRGRRRGN